MVILRKRREKLHGLYSSWDVKGRIVTVNTFCHGRDLHGNLAPLHICCALYFTFEKINTHWVKGPMSLYYTGKRSSLSREAVTWSFVNQHVKMKDLVVKHQQERLEHLWISSSFVFRELFQICKINAGFLTQKRKLNLDVLLTSSATGWHKGQRTVSSVELRLAYPFLLLQVPDIVSFHFMVNGTLNGMG